MKDEEDDDFDDIGEDDDDAGIDVETVNLSHRASRARRGWRDIERMREQKEIERLLRDDDWFDELDHA